MPFSQSAKVVGASFIKVLFVGILSLPVWAEEVTLKTTKIVEGLYVIEGVGGFAGGNMAVSVGDDGVVLIDDSMPPFLGKLNAAIKSISDKPLDFLINTHVHGDHTGNNASLAKAGAHIVAHSKLRERMKTKTIEGAEGQKLPMPAKALPVITFDEAISFYLNGGEINVFHVANAHTDGDAVIHFKGLNVIHSGDTLFNGLFPFIDLASGGSVDGYIAAQKKLYKLADKNTIIIPGHGPVTNREALKDSYTMLINAQKSVAILKKKGMSEDDVVAANPLAQYHDDWNWGFISTEKMTRTLYQNLAK